MQDKGCPEALEHQFAGTFRPIIGNDDQSFNQRVNEFQRGVINQALAQNNDVWARAADQLKINRSNLHRLAKRLELIS